MTTTRQEHTQETLDEMAQKSDDASVYWHIRVRPKTPHLDGHGRDMLHEIRRIGLGHIEGVRSSRVYLLRGRLDEAQVRHLSEALLTDPVAELGEVGSGLVHRVDKHPSIEVHTLPGVMNPAAMSALEAASRELAHGAVGKAGLEEVQTARRYEIIGARDASELDRIASGVLANSCMESWYISGFDRSDSLPTELAVPPAGTFALKHISLIDLDDEGLARLSRDGHLFLSLDEMRTIRDYYRDLGREPTDLELETLAQTWSEHCVHKTLKSAVDYRGDDFGRAGSTQQHFDNLLKDTIMAATKRLDRDWCLSVFTDNAGVIAFDDELGVAFKVETHNHPSAIEPYGGSATGIGGCIRDIMGCGLGAKPIASTDVFCLAPPDFDAARLPKDVLHPRRVLRGVVRGVRDYGNRMGIPTVNGALHFDERYLANPLVFCGCVGIIPRDRVDKEPRPGDRIVVAGGRTGRDGIHGATFSSAELTETHADEFSHAVQIGHAIEEKKVLDALLLARDFEGGCLYSSVTDCGAGGLSSAVGEMAEHLGAVVDLEQVPLKYTGLRYDEIWISEAQERMVFAVPPEQLDKFLRVFANEEVEVTVIGTFSDDGKLRIRFDDVTVGELDMKFLHHGYPRPTVSATWTASGKAADQQCEADADAASNERLLAALSDWGTASKEWVIRQYDHEVQGRSVVKPLAGPGIGPSDASVVRPRYDSLRGVAIGCGMAPELADVDPYLMSIAAVDEALRNVICVGANPEHTAILDNFCWPKADTPESLGALVRACRGAADAGVAYGLPFISGKDSLNNEFSMSAAEAVRTGLPEQIAIPYTLLISAIGVVEDVSRCVTMDLKDDGNRLVLASAPYTSVGLAEACAMHHRVAELIQSECVRSAHDVSDGGLAVTIAEMCIAGNLGASIDVSCDVFGSALLDPVTTTYVLEMTPADADESGLPVIGRVERLPKLMIRWDDVDVVALAVDELAKAWRSSLADGGGGSDG